MTYFCIDLKKVETANLQIENIFQKLNSSKEKFDKIQKQIATKMPQFSKNLNVIKCCLEQQINIGQEYAEGINGIFNFYKEIENVVLNNKTNALVKDKENSSEENKIKDPDSMSYEEYLEYRYENAADENTKKVYKKYLDNIKIRDKSYDGTAHYNGFWNEIKYDMEADSENERGPGCTYYHEVGHLIDDQSDWNSYTSTDWSYDFYDKLEQDINNWITKIKNEQGYTDIEDVYDYMSSWLYQDANNKNGVSDLVNGITGGEACGRWLHEQGYYNSSSISKEAFAHFFEAGMAADPTKLNYIKEIFPTAYKEYQKMLKDELK